MSKEKVKRNQQIARLIESGMTYEAVRIKMGLKAKSTVYEIAKRYLKNKDVRGLST